MLSAIKPGRNVFAPQAFPSMRVDALPHSSLVDQTLIHVVTAGSRNLESLDAGREHHSASTPRLRPSAWRSHIKSQPPSGDLGKRQLSPTETPLPAIETWSSELKTTTPETQRLNKSHSACGFREKRPVLQPAGTITQMNRQ